MRRRSSYYVAGGAPKSIALLTLVGSIVGGSHAVPGSGSPLSSSSSSLLRIRSIIPSSSSSIRSSMIGGSGECNNSFSSTMAASASSSAAVASSACLFVRGGAVDDDPRRSRRTGGYDDYNYNRDDDNRIPPPSRRSSSLEDRDRYSRSSGPPRPESRRGDGPRRPPPPSRGDREDGGRYYGRYDNDDRMNNKHREFREKNGRREYHDRGEDYRRRGRDAGSNVNAKKEDEEEDDGGKSKKWFSLKKDKKTKEEKEDVDDMFRQGDVPPMQQPPPPPPPPPPPDGASSAIEINPAETERTPIHYMFPTAEAAAEERKLSDATVDDATLLNEEGGAGTTDGDGFVDDTPFLDVREEEFPERDYASTDGRGRQQRQRRRRDDGDDNEGDGSFSRASPRRDAVTMFMSTKRGSLQVRMGSMIVGAALGGFIGKSLLNDPVMMSIAMSALLLITGFLRNDYGELSRALGLALVLTLRRTRSVRKEYPTLPHIKAMIRQGPRKPFPPVNDEGDSPWRYEPVYRDDPEFKMTYALLAMALVGSFCGGNVPILPAWMGGIAGAVAFASFTTGSNARGDLGRSMGMRVVGLVQLIMAIQSELRILGKSATVAGLIFDKVMIMDRKHRIKDKIVAMGKWGYDKVSRTAEQVKEDMQDERPERRR